MEISLSLSLTGRLLSSSPATALFSVPGSRGFFYDFSDYSTQFTDTAGTTAITGVGQSLGLVLDKSAGLVRGPELATVTSVTGVAIGGPAFTNYIVTPTLTVNTTYEISFTVSGYSGSGDVGVAASGSRFSPAVGTAVISGNGVVRFIGINVTASALSLYTRSTNTANFSNISVRELPGNHATQATAGSRALTQVRPMFTQRNRAVGSELPENNFYWQASLTTNGVTYTRVAAGIDTDGLPYADYSVVGTATSDSFFEPQLPTTQRIPAVTGQTWTVSMIARRLSGAAPGAGEGVIPYIRGETAPSTITETSTLVYSPASAETTLVTTFTLANAATNQIRSSVSFRVAAGSTANYTMRVKGYQLELGSTRTTYQPAVSGELRNLTLNSGRPDLWNGGIGLSNGITVTRVASGVDTDGLPYGDFNVSGTATANDFRAIVGISETRRAATGGQTFTSAIVVRLISGTAPPVGNGVFSEVTEENSSFVYLVGTASAVNVPATDTLRVATRTLSDPAVAFTRGGAIIATLSGTTVNYTVRIKGVQFEQASTYSRYQRTITANEWYEPGFTSYRGLRFDGTDDFLQTAAIDFAGAESLGPELVTNGDFSVGTGWTLGTGVTISGGVANLAAGSLYLEQGITTVAGRSYKVTATASNGAFCGAWDVANQNNVLSGSATTRTGTFSFTFTANDTQSFIAFTASGAGATTIDNVSVREVLIPADKMTVVAGVRKLSDAAQGILAELTANAGTIPNSFNIQAPGPATSYRIVSGGSLAAGAVFDATGLAAPRTEVLTGLANISGATASLRANGVQVAGGSAAQGTGNYANDIVFIGRRGGTANPFNGVLTFLCVINRTLTASELAQLETFANSRTGAY